MSVIPASKRAGLGTEEALGCGRNILAREVEGFEELGKEQRSLSGPNQNPLSSPACRRSPFFSVQSVFLYLNGTTSLTN